MPDLHLPIVERLLHRLDELTPLWRMHAAEADRLTRLPQAVVDELRAWGLFKLWVPQRYAGAELDLVDTLRIYEAVSRIDGSIGWGVMIGTGGGLFAAYLDPVVASELYGPQDAVIAGSGAPAGYAEIISGGYRVNGRWRYASGAHYATTFTANCLVTRDGQQVVDAAGKPLIRAMAFRPEQVTIHDAWDTVGMRGTGSHDFSVQDVIVPRQHTFSLSTDVTRESGPLYRLPFAVLTELPIAAVALGIARHALDAFAKLSNTKKSSDGALLATHPITQMRVAKGEACYRALHEEIHALAARTWQTALMDQSLTAQASHEITATSVRCLSDLQRAVFELAMLAGMNAITHHSEFARAWRDLQTLAAHAAVSPLRVTGIEG